MPADLDKSAGQLAIPCSLYRGGTSRGVLFLGRDLPYPREVINRILLRVIGSPDPRQTDGVGGGTSLTSKAMILDPADSAGDDVRMTFAQVAVNAATVDWGGTCGNMTAAVGAFAIESGLVAAVEPVTRVRIRSVNTGGCVVAHVPVRAGQVVTEGEYEMAGVPGTGARMVLEFFEPGGSITGKLLPTGHRRDDVTLADGRVVTVSIVDAVNPVVFCEAAALGLSGTESVEAIAGRGEVCDALEQIRSIAAEMLSIVPSRAQATRVSPGIPKVAVVAPPAAYTAAGGGVFDARSHDVQVRLMAMQAPHRSLAVSGAICTAAASAIVGTVVHAASAARPAGEAFRIAHPAGLMDVGITITTDEKGGPHVVSARVGRTARRIMSGVAWVQKSVVGSR